MFENYKSSYNLDLWEAIDRDQVEDYYESTTSFTIEETLEALDRKYLSEGVEVDDKYYDNLDDLYHIGKSKEFTNPKQFLKAMEPFTFVKTYKYVNDYPVDFFIEAIDPQSLHRIAFMITYTKVPVGEDGGEKPVCELIMYKGKALATEILSNKHRLAFLIKNVHDIDKVLADKALRITWHWQKKVINNLKPSEAYYEMRMAMSKLQSAKYDFINSDDIEDYI